MSKTKTISDEAIIAALLDHGTIRAAAEAVGLSERTIYDRMSDGEFQALYRAAKSDLVRAALLRINRHLERAIDTVAGIMEDKDNNAAVRLQAAQTIINNAGKFAQRLQTNETGVLSQQEINKFSVF